MDIIARRKASGKELIVRRCKHDVVKFELTQTALNQKDKYSASAFVSVPTLVKVLSYAEGRAYQRGADIRFQMINGTAMHLRTAEPDRRANRIMLLIQNAGQGSVIQTFMYLEQSDLLALISEIYYGLEIQRPPTTN